MTIDLDVMEGLAKAWQAITPDNPSKTGNERGAFRDALDTETVLSLIAAARERDALREQMSVSLAWHEEREKGLSKQPPGGSRDWQRMEHQEEIARIRQALNTGDQS